MTVLLERSEPEQFREIVASRFGLRFDDGKLGFLGELLRRRADTRGMDVPRYLSQVSDDGSEAGPLATELTVNETYFFRNSDQFRAFEQVLHDRMRARAGHNRLSFLSAGCSSGEEPYSIAMLTRALVPTPPWQVSIRAVDLSPAMLSKAAAGRYANWALREMPADMLAQWFTPVGRDRQLSDEIRNAVRFDCRNLADPGSDIWQPGAYDAIFCRNVIMYFTPEVQQAVVGRIARSLAPGGFLFLGHAETLRGLSQDFHLVHTHGTFYYQRRAPGDAPPAYDYVDSTPYAFSAPVAPMPLAPGDTSWFDAIGLATQRIEALARPALTPQPSGAAPAIPSPHWNLEVALDLLQRERFAEALELIGRLPEEASADPDVLLLQALLLVQGSQPAAAAEVCRELLAKDEFSAGANYVLALCFEASGDIAGAVMHYGIASHLDPEFAMPLLRRGVLARRSGELAQAAEHLRRAKQLLEHEDVSRLVLFGGGFTRSALTQLCTAELAACGVKQ